MRGIKLLVFLFLIGITDFQLIGQVTETDQLDVISYQVQLEPHFTNNSIEGSVIIKFQVPVDAKEVTFDSGTLKVTNIEGAHLKGFIQKGKKTIISLSPNDQEFYVLKIFYHGTPKRGLLFSDDTQELYSLYFTSEWMICNATSDDRATFNLDLLIPKELVCIASGYLTDTTAVGDKLKYSWRQDYETPPYTYGFSIGPFKNIKEKYNDQTLAYYSEKYNPEELSIIFQYTGDMMRFFVEKTGIPFPQDTYSQILIGHHYQEMSGFAVLKKSYGEMILKDSTETNLISHELAHQWWGNRINCKNWNHFWLNEGFATFMSAAYNEHRFGKEKYQKDINSYFKVYEKIKAKGKDKSLVFEDWSNPSRDDRNLVYFKGAYVLHLLRLELGEEVFWKGIKLYTQTYYGKSVTTKDFQIAMEEASNQSLDHFFKRWIY